MERQRSRKTTLDKIRNFPRLLLVVVALACLMAALALTERMEAKESAMLILAAVGAWLLSRKFRKK